MGKKNKKKKTKEYLRKRLREKEERVALAEKEKRVKKIVSVSLAVVSITLVITGVFHLVSSREDESGPPPELQITPMEHDADTVSIADGDVTFTYEIENNGKGDLKIDRIWTTCGCTEARLKVGERTSQKFGMHDSAPFWSQTISPGEKGFLEVVFDPGFHGPGGTGPVTRAVYLSTNDPLNKEARVLLSANVIP